jgi:hypothetical protein
LQIAAATREGKLPRRRILLQDSSYRLRTALESTAPPEAERAKFESKKRLHVQDPIQDFKDGRVRAVNITDKHAL